ncbi:MAG: hypothetical protein BWX70_00037 [Verrucomicrobia bacterium ADurb.Bin070]|jgi:Fe2+ transport system protein FeoA|nr:MAG: hypothetical protein BWX70_00037 [Verrucomicrobia bacterium ADurb.Bin070]
MSHPDDLHPALSTGRSLMDLKDGEGGIIRANHDRKSAEMGLFPGVRVQMFRNRKHERSLVIGAGEARFLVSRAIAKKVEMEG